MPNIQKRTVIQPIHKSADAPYVELYCGDCLEVIPELDSKFSLIFADPPFNYRQEYDDCKDSWSDNSYRQFTTLRTFAANSVLNDHGSLWINVPDEIVSHVDTVATTTCGLTRINWCIWHFKFGQCNRSRFIRSKTHLLYYAKNPQDRIWNPDAIAVLSDRATKYGDKRTLESATPCKRVPLDVWSVDNDGAFWGRVQGNSAERCEGHPNQLPEKMLERIISACTNPGDWILDPFSGSGTTCTVARALGRNSVGIDVSSQYCKNGFDRAMRGAVRVGKP